eukprot:14911239-Alexandrium_andersonii.AAC.1
MASRWAGSVDPALSTNTWAFTSGLRFCRTRATVGTAQNRQEGLLTAHTRRPSCGARAREFLTRGPRHH